MKKLLEGLFILNIIFIGTQVYAASTTGNINPTTTTTTTTKVTNNTTPTSSATDIKVCCASFGYGSNMVKSSNSYELVNKNACVIPAGMIVGGGKEIVSDSFCKTTPTQPVVIGCSVGFNYNPETGKQCSNVLIKDGCFKGFNYSSTTGQKCSIVPSITVISPNGGETIYQEKGSLISWKGGSGLVQVGLVYSDWTPTNNRLLGWITTNARPDGTVNFDGKNVYDLIMKNARKVLPNAYKILVVSADKNGNYCTYSSSSSSYSECNNYDLSDSYFKIISEKSSITVLSPNGGESVEVGKDIDIKWSSTAPSSYYVDIFVSDGTAKGSVKRTLNTGSYKYSLSSNLIAGSNYKVYISLSSDSSIKDVSDNTFEIKSTSSNFLSCNKNNYTVALILVSKDISATEKNIYNEKLSYIKNRFPWAFNYATGGLATISIPDEATILDSVGLFKTNGEVDERAVTKKFYESHGDDYDFLYIFTNTGVDQQGYYRAGAQNRTNGIGSNKYDISNGYGSKGRLLSVYYMNYLLDTDQLQSCYNIQKNNFDSLTIKTECGMAILLHETAHQWSAYIGDRVSGSSPSLVDLGILKAPVGHYYEGLSTPSGTRDLLGASNWEKVPNSTSYRNYIHESDVYKYHPFTLYFMGVLPEDQYDTKFNVLQNKTIEYTPYETIRLMDSVYKQVSVRDLIKRAGPRGCYEVTKITRTLEIGMYGDDVQVLQYFLGAIADSTFGYLTQASLIEWQKKNGLIPNGVFDLENRLKAGL